MSCCGGGTIAGGQGAVIQSAQTPMPSAMSAPAIGSGGMILLDYAGITMQTFTGSNTGATYRFGGSRLTGYVDTQDAGELLSTGAFTHASTVLSINA